MVNVPGIARLGMLAVGLGIGAAWPTRRSPRPTRLPTGCRRSMVFSGGGAVAAPAISGLNLAISFDGQSLVSDGSATAYTTSGDYDLAIAYGANSQAEAVDGTVVADLCR
jgi:hypothetical protein